MRGFRPETPIGETVVANPERHKLDPVTAGISCWDHRSQVKNIEETLTGFLNLVAPLFGLTICRTGKRCFRNVVFLGSVIPGPNPHCVSRIIPSRLVNTPFLYLCIDVEDGQPLRGAQSIVLAFPLGCQA